ncbi:MAG: DNA gyrase inhibitor YacG [Holophagaceae bacterium]|nr:DNA gyrase inhibitor YacG [Holophagaceae bacterium]
MKPINCPVCRSAVPWENNPWRPFCSERCKVHDLGAWSGEDYRIPVEPENEEGESWSGLEEL